MKKAKIFLISGLIILGLAIFGYFKATPGIENQSKDLPEIEISPKTFDFGEIEYGKVAEYTFKVKNVGNEALEIKRIATSCPCTTAKIDKEKINPQGEKELIVSYDTGAMPALHGRGEQERIIYIQSNDPINPQVEVTIYANVK